MGPWVVKYEPSVLVADLRLSPGKVTPIEIERRFDGGAHPIEVDYDRRDA